MRIPNDQWYTLFESDCNEFEIEVFRRRCLLYVFDKTRLELCPELYIWPGNYAVKNKPRLQQFNLIEKIFISKLIMSLVRSQLHFLYLM